MTGSKNQNLFKKLIKIPGVDKLIKLGLSIGIKLSSLIISIYAIRWITSQLSASDLQAFNLATFYNTALISIFSFGFSVVLFRAYNTIKDQFALAQIWSTIIFIQLCVFIVSIIILSIINNFTAYLPLSLIYLSFIAQFILAVDGNFKSITDTKNITWQFTASEFITKSLLVICLIFVSSNNTLNQSQYLRIYIWIISILGLLQLGIDFYWQRKHYQFTLPNFKSLLPFKKDILNLTLISFLIAISSQSDRWFLNRFGYNELVFNGYILAYKLFELAMVVQSIVIPTMFSNLIQGRDLTQSWKEFVLKSKWFYLMLSLGIFSSLGFIIASYILLPIIDVNRQYIKYAFDVIPYLSIILLFDSFNFFLSNLFIHKNKIHIETFGLIFYAVFSLVLYVTLIPPLGHIGAGLASLISSLGMIGFKLLYYILSKNLS